MTKRWLSIVALVILLALALGGFALPHVASFWATTIGLGSATGSTLTSPGGVVNVNSVSGINLNIAATTYVACTTTECAFGQVSATGPINTNVSYKVSGVQISAANLSNGTTGSGNVVLASAPNLSGGGSWGGSPTLGSTSSSPLDGMRLFSITIGSDTLAAAGTAGDCVSHTVASGTGNFALVGSPLFISPTSGYISAGVDDVDVRAWVSATGTPVTVTFRICNRYPSSFSTSASSAYNAWVVVSH